MVVGGALVAACWFPLPLTWALALLAALYEPLAPLAVGVLLDLLAYSGVGYTAPWQSISGLALTVMAVVAHRSVVSPRSRL